jgi:hypothetical protein
MSKPVRFSRKYIKRLSGKDKRLQRQEVGMRPVADFYFANGKWKRKRDDAGDEQAGS